MSSNLDYKQVANVSRRTWDVEAYEKKAKARESQANAAASSRSGATDDRFHQAAATDDKEEFTPAESGAQGPEGSKRSFLKARREKVDVDSKVGTSEMVSLEAAATSSSSVLKEEKDGAVVKTGVGWHCKVCDCFLKDSHTYLDHINGRKHQRKLGYSMRVERSNKDQLMSRLKSLTEEKKLKEMKSSSLLDEPTAGTNYDEIVKERDDALLRRKEERRRRRKERKQMKKAEQKQEKAEELQDETEEQTTDEVVEEGIDPAMAAVMGFSGFGGSSKNL